MQSLISMLQRSTFGEPWYNVEFVGIECQKSDFCDYKSGCGDTQKIKQHGWAIQTAETFREEEWFLTKSNILVCGKVPRLPILQVSISVDKNLSFLISQDFGRIKKGYAVEVLIEDLGLPKKTVIGHRHGCWAVFLGIPK